MLQRHYVPIKFHLSLNKQFECKNINYIILAKYLVKVIDRFTSYIFQRTTLNIK